MPPESLSVIHESTNRYVGAALLANVASLTLQITEIVQLCVAVVTLVFISIQCVRAFRAARRERRQKAPSLDLTLEP